MKTKTKKDHALELMEQGYGDPYIAQETGSTMSSVRTYRVAFNRSRLGNLITQSQEFRCRPIKKTKKAEKIFVALEIKDELDVCNEFNLTEKTLMYYKTLYRKQFGLRKKSRINFRELTFAQQVYIEGKQIEGPKISQVEIEQTKVEQAKVEEPKMEELKMEEPKKIEEVKLVENLIESIKDLEHESIKLKIGNNVHTFKIYTYDELGWLDFNYLIEILKKEIEFDINDPNLKIHNKYITTVQIDNKYINLLDVNALPNFASKLDDYTLMDSSVKLLTRNEGIFYRIRTILNVIELINVLQCELDQIGTSKIEVYETIECDLLHELEKKKYKGQKLIEKGTKLIEVLNERRVFKNDFVLKKVLRHTMADNQCTISSLNGVKNRLSTLLHCLYNKNYSPKSDALEEEWQIEIVERHLNGTEGQ